MVLYTGLLPRLLMNWVLKETVGVASVGCSYNNYEYFNCDMAQAAHGRAPAVATGIQELILIM